jgi:hypothetical protein
VVRNLCTIVRRKKKSPYFRKLDECVFVQQHFIGVKATERLYRKRVHTASERFITKSIQITSTSTSSFIMTTLNNNRKPAVSFIETPKAADVLCGKDKTFGKHPGNMLYRDLIEAKALDYAAAIYKLDKMKLTTEIVATMVTEFGKKKCFRCLLLSLLSFHTDKLVFCQWLTPMNLSVIVRKFS